MSRQKTWLQFEMLPTATERIILKAIQPPTTKVQLSNIWFFWKLNWLVSKKKHNLRFIFWQPVRGLVQLFLFIGKKYCRFPFCAFPVEHEAIIYMNGPELRWKFHCLSFPSFHIFARLLAIMSRLRNWRYFKPQLKVMLSDQNVQTILIASNSNS